MGPAPALALLSVLLLGPLHSEEWVCDGDQMSADLERFSRAAAERLRSEDEPFRNVEDRARWRSLLPAVSLRSVLSERTSELTGSGSRFYSEIDSETVLETSRESGFASSRTAPTGVAVTATWDLMPLIFSPRENSARVFRRETYMRSRRRNGELSKAVETAQAAVRRLGQGSGDAILACIEAHAAVDQVKFLLH